MTHLQNNSATYSEIDRVTWYSSDPTYAVDDKVSLLSSISNSPVITSPKSNNSTAPQSSVFVSPKQSNG
jgi:hypothetical protein